MTGCSKSPRSSKVTAKPGTFLRHDPQLRRRRNHECCRLRRAHWRLSRVQARRRAIRCRGLGRPDPRPSRRKPLRSNEIARPNRPKPTTCPGTPKNGLRQKFVDAGGTSEAKPQDAEAPAMAHDIAAPRRALPLLQFTSFRPATRGQGRQILSGTRHAGVPQRRPVYCAREFRPRDRPRPRPAGILYGSRYRLSSHGRLEARLFRRCESQANRKLSRNNPHPAADAP